MPSRDPARAGSFGVPGPDALACVAVVTADQIRQVLTPFELTVIGLARERGQDPELIHAALLQGLYTWDWTPEGGYGIRRYQMEGGEGSGRRRGGGQSDRPQSYITPGTRGVPSREDVEEALVSARGKLMALAAMNRRAELNGTGKRATIPRHVTRTPKEESMAEDEGKDPTPAYVAAQEMEPGMVPADGRLIDKKLLGTQEGFADRVAREAQDEAQVIVGDLERLRFRADQVARVLKALGLPIPRPVFNLTELEAVEEFVNEAGERKLRMAVKLEPAQEAQEPAKSPGEPEPASAPVPDPAGAEEAPAGVQGAAREAARSVRRERTGKVEFPEELLAMPAAQSRPSSTAIKAAQRQKKVLEFVEGRLTVIAGEVHEAMPHISTAQASDDLRALHAAELIVRTNVNRRMKGVQHGRASVEYGRKVAPVEEPTATHIRETLREEGVHPTGLNPQALAKVRDEVRKHKGGEPFTVQTIAGLCSLGEDLTRRCLLALMEREVVKGTPVEEPTMFAYQKPTDPGDAFRLEQQRRKEQEAEERKNGVHAHGGGGAVPGTGQKVRGSDKDMNALMDKVEEAGGKVARVGSDHFALINPANNQRVIVGSTEGAGPGSKTIKRLAEIGLTV